MQDYPCSQICSLEILNFPGEPPAVKVTQALFSWDDKSRISHVCAVSAGTSPWFNELETVFVDMFANFPSST